MFETAMVLFSALAGLLFGGVFFAGLWWTVTRGVTVRRTKELFVISFLLRAAVLLLSFYYIAGEDAIRMGGYMVGFWGAKRIALQRLPVT